MRLCAGSAGGSAVEHIISNDKVISLILIVDNFLFFAAVWVSSFHGARLPPSGEVETQDGGESEILTGTQS